MCAVLVGTICKCVQRIYLSLNLWFIRVCRRSSDLGSIIRECLLMMHLYQSVSLAAIISVTSVDFSVHKGSTSLDAGNITAHCRHWVMPLRVRSFWMPQPALYRAVVPKRPTDSCQGIYVYLLWWQIVIWQNYPIRVVVSQDAIRCCCSCAIRPTVGILLPVYGSYPHLRNSNTIKKEKPPTSLKLWFSKLKIINLT